MIWFIIIESNAVFRLQKGSIVIKGFHWGPEWKIIRYNVHVFNILEGTILRNYRYFNTVHPTILNLWWTLIVYETSILMYAEL